MRITRLSGKAEGIAHVDAEALELEKQRIQVGIQESSGHQVRQVLIAQAQPLRQGLCRRQGAHGRGLVRIPVESEPFVGVGGGEYRVLGRRDAQSFRQDLSAVIGIGVYIGEQFKVVGGTKRIQPPATKAS